jgi:hypothetical protein
MNRCVESRIIVMGSITFLKMPIMMLLLLQIYSPSFENVQKN